MRRLIILTILLLLAAPCYGTVLFEDSFDASDDWTITQSSDSSSNCISTCGIGGGWDFYRNGYCMCDNGLSGEPGNNDMYIDQYAGYPDETNTCRGDAGKCLTHWAESCSAVFDNSDGMIGVDLGEEYSDIYVRFYFRSKDGWEFADNKQEKMYHMQHYDPAE